MTPELLLSKTDYVEGQKEVAHRVLIELANLFSQYKEEICVIGGWVPSLMYPNENHIGSIDVDILVNHLLIKDAGYQNMSKVLLRNGYRKHAEKYFTFVKVITIDNIDYHVDVDILAGRYGGTNSKFSQHVQGVKALKATGGDYAFNFPHQKIEIEAVRPDGIMDFAEINVIAVVPYFIMKVAALGRGKPKDAYDIYFILKHYHGGIHALISLFLPYKSKQIIIDMKNKLNMKFKSDRHSGVQDIIDFIEPNDYEESEILRRDIYERFKLFLESID